MGATADLVDFALRADPPPAILRAATRHLVDTLGVTVAGLGQGVAARLAPLQPEGDLPLPGHAARRFAADHAYLCGTAAHGLELDDGYREGSVHPGVAILPALMAEALDHPVTGARFLTAYAIGYEVICTLSATLHPALRMLFYPAAYVGQAEDHRAQFTTVTRSHILRHLHMIDRRWAHDRPGVLLDLYLTAAKNGFIKQS